MIDGKINQFKIKFRVEKLQTPICFGVAKSKIYGNSIMGNNSDSACLRLPE